MSKATKSSTTKNTRRTNPYPPISTSAAMTSPVSPSGNRSAAPWSAEDDDQLKSARQRGMGWAPIAKELFPSKSPNACRKRYERLLDKAQSVESWDRTKLDKMARLYCESREQMWRLVATRLGEKWQTVEAKVRSYSSSGGQEGQSLTLFAVHGERYQNTSEHRPSLRQGEQYWRQFGQRRSRRKWPWARVRPATATRSTLGLGR